MVKNCVYRFLNDKNEVIYIGKAKDLKKRLNGHNHLNEECYVETSKIEYISFKTEDDMNFAERYFIMKFNPKYNVVLSDKDFNLNSIDLDIKIWKKYSEKIINEIDSANEEIKCLEQLLNELKEIQIKIDTLREFDLVWSDNEDERFNKQYKDLINRKHNLKDKINTMILNTLDDDVPQWIVDEFIDNGVYSIKDLINLKLKEIEHKYYSMCDKQILEYGYYREEIYELIDHEFICYNISRMDRWKMLLDGEEIKSPMEKYRINKDLKNNTVKQIIDNIENKLYSKYGESEKEVILLESCSEYPKIIIPDYDYMIFNKPFIVYKFNISK